MPARRLYRNPLVVISLLFIIAGSIWFWLKTPKTTLERIRHRGEIVMLTRNTLTTYYEGLDGKTGLEYDLAKRFAESLDVDLVVKLPKNIGDMIPMLNGYQADFIAAGLTITEPRQQQLRFGPAYQIITQQLIYNQNQRAKPEGVADILNGNLQVIAGSSFVERLVELQQEFPELNWTELDIEDTDSLLYKIANGEIDYTIVDSNEFELSRRFYPELNAAFAISEGQQLAWGFRQSSADASLYQAAIEFFAKIQADGTLTHLLEQYYSYARLFKSVETTEFLRHVKNRLPIYQELFQLAAEEYGFDWRILAAIGYQESHWQTHAISPTGVRGIMMLTEKTAGQFNIKNRLDARESILGGANYLRNLKDRLPDDILEPDRTWMAVAAYNIGLGHLEDARKITEGQGGDPHKWNDLKKYLPLLSQPKWHSKTKYGYARGREPVIYVRNIRSYYDILVWLDKRQNPEEITIKIDPAEILPASL